MPGPIDMPMSLQTRRRIAVVTGTRAEFGLLKPVMHAIQRHHELDLLVIAAGSHLVMPAETFFEVKRHFPITDSVPMQIAGRTTRADDAEALGKGVARFTRSFNGLRPDWVVVLGDRIEAFAAASAASVGGWALAHIHGGDRAEGIADEAMRHAITKLAHLHFAATPLSGERIIGMGERPETVHVVGSPALDELPSIAPLDDSRFEDVGSPTVVFLMHPVGRPMEVEEIAAMSVLAALAGEHVLILHPNLDPGRDGVMSAIQALEESGKSEGPDAPPAPGHRARAAAVGVRHATIRSHVPRETLIGLFKRMALTGGPRGGVLVGNSSAGLIEAAAVGLPAVDIGPRQNGRERCANAVHVEYETRDAVAEGLRQARLLRRGPISHPFGDGRAGERIASVLAGAEPREFTRKRCTY